jgi:uncharacterized protein
MDMKTNESMILENYHVVAVVGLSADETKASHHVAKHLQENGYRIIPVNPTVKNILGESCYPDLLSIPEPVEVVDIFRRPDDVLPIVEQAVKIGVKAVWMQEGIVNQEAAARAKQSGIMVVMDKCMLKEHMKLTDGNRT